MWILLAIGCALCWSLGNVLQKPAYKQLTPSQMYTLNGVFFLFIWLGFQVITKTQIEFINWTYIVLPSVPPLAFILYIIAIKKGKISIVSAVSSTSVLLTVFFAVLFLNESVSIIQFLLILAIVCALVLLGITEKKHERASVFSGFLLGILVAITFGFANALSKYILVNINAVSFSIINGLWMLIIGFVWLWLDRKLKNKNWQAVLTKTGKIGLIGSLIYSFGSFFLFLALEKGLVTVVIPITKLTTPLTLIFATIVLKEKLLKYQIIIILILFLSILGLTIT